MDPFSQAALGAVVGQVAGHRKLGYRAAVYGAAAGALPDIDVLFSIGGDFVDQLITHRGITHSLFFAPVIGPLLGWLIWHRERQRKPDEGDPGSRHTWMLVVTLALWSHPLLDLLTPYGTQLFLPFSNARFAVNAMPIIDPAYTLLLGTGLLLGWLPSVRARFPAALLAVLTLLVSSGYLGYGWLQGIQAEQAARKQLTEAGVVPDQLAAFPTIFQVHLRRVVARSPDVDRVGFYSTWSPCSIEWHEAPRLEDEHHGLLQSFLATRAGGVFDWFSMGWAHFDLNPEEDGHLLTASDLRYGFDNDPLISIFTVTALLDQHGEARETAAAGRTRPTDPEQALNRLLSETYAPACRIFGSRGVSEDAIPAHMDDNEANEPDAS